MLQVLSRMAILAALSGALLAQQPAIEQHPLTGSVVNAITGEPLRKVLITLQTSESQNAAFTDATGRFEILSVPDGNYNLQFRKPGFFDPDQPFQNWPSSIQVKVSAAAPPLTLKLLPAGTITGRVVDGQGEPVESANLLLTQTRVQNGAKQTTMAGSTSSDSEGNYEFNGLAPGTYRVHMNMRVAPPGLTAGHQQSNSKARVYPAQYYPQASDASGSQAILLAPGATEKADFTVTAVPAFRVSGRVVPIRPGIVLNLTDDAGNYAGATIPANPRNGSWSFENVPNGTWHVSARLQTPEGGLQGDEAVTVNSADLNQVDLQLQQGGTTIPVVVNGVEQGLGNLPLVLVRDTAQESIPFQQQEYVPESTGNGSSQPNSAFKNILPGHYRVTQRSFGGLCIDSVTSGGADLARDGITVSPGTRPAPVEVNVGTDCGSLQVKVNKPNEIDPAIVVLVPDDPLLAPFEMQTNGPGPFAFNVLKPGAYRLYAFDTTGGLEYTNPEVMRSFKATEASLTANQNQSITLDVIVRKKAGFIN